MPLIRAFNKFAQINKKCQVLQFEKLIASGLGLSSIALVQIQLPPIIPSTQLYLLDAAAQENLVLRTLLREKMLLQF